MQLCGERYQLRLRQLIPVGTKEMVEIPSLAHKLRNGAVDIHETVKPPSLAWLLLFHWKAQEQSSHRKETLATAPFR